MQTINYTGARNQLAALMEAASRDREPITIARNGAGKVVLLAVEAYEAMETPDASSLLHQSECCPNPAKSGRLRRGKYSAWRAMRLTWLPNRWRDYPLFVVLFVIVLMGPATAAVTVFGPSGYQRRSDSPFYQGLIHGDIYLEDFEDRQVSVPGVHIRSGGILGPDLGVDEDDGNLDGLGRNLVWIASTPILPRYGLEIQFDADPIKGYPLFAGAALLGFTTLPNTFRVNQCFQAIDGLGNDLTGEVCFEALHLPVGTNYFSTAGNRFIGIYSSTGISRLLISPSCMDHLQYGWSIPEPGLTGLLSAAAMSLFMARRRQPRAAPQPRADVPPPWSCRSGIRHRESSGG